MRRSELAATLSRLSIKEEGNVETLVVDGADSLARLKKELEHVKLLAWDCEGVNLSRIGSVTLIQFAIDREDGGQLCFLLDMLSPIKDQLFAFAKQVLEDESVLKVIHDPAADADCLLHCHGITVVNVHDTQAWHMTLRRCYSRPNLNLTLEAWNLPLNTHKNASFNPYKSNPAYWASRPLTETMIQVAGGDVYTTIPLYRMQIANSFSNPTGCEQACAKSQARLQSMRSLPTFEVRVPQHEVGRFIGSRGCNINSMEIALSGCITCDKNSDGNSFLVYTNLPQNEAKAIMRRETNGQVTIR
ncbi:hypothetical protein GUITHDRAFT_62690 [Guillardia theta CCMP2712]|uniref:3'-5' exonuclease domain-containing protein n=1 Tax=Guillardia theta (strain CCMP2712) TaxID=905079 RepID=L1K4A1_GUITC|nr:hypothetical protein GUITHDRAFT_62690 [Guillardia theta CCMP2712]EKX55193.1 hypothetical protein GUITHDRAFT_62690 [Guillardia theta CCMP2712]|eukprot:XP_005842173.1 hypothetical protein GUITHDRAFT_62690 [Guillardia theta CCMP2712]